MQREQLRDTVEPERALSIADNMEIVHQNQQRKSSNNNNVISSAIKALQQFGRFRGANVRMNQSSKNKFNLVATGLCRGCGQNWTTRHSQNWTTTLPCSW